MAKNLTLKEAQALLQKTTKRLAELEKEWDRIRRQGDILANKEKVLDREYCKVDNQKYIAEQSCKHRLAEAILAQKLKNLPARRCVFDRRDFIARARIETIRFRRTFFRNMTGGYIAINAKGKQKSFSFLDDAKRWASDKPLVRKPPKGIDITALNQAIAKAGFKVVRK